MPALCMSALDVKAEIPIRSLMSANDPKRTFTRERTLRGPSTTKGAPRNPGGNGGVIKRGGWGEFNEFTYILVMSCLTDFHRRRAVTQNVTQGVYTLYHRA